MISVFDGNPDTNVVCQGYARAFQYLMDHSVFSDKTVRSRIVSSSTHAWNVVTIGGKNYFLDVTWYDRDESQSGLPNASEFILGSQKTLDELKNGTFSREVNGTVINYPASDAHSPYSAETKSFYTAKELAVSPVAYDMSSDHSSGTGRYYNWKQYR